MFTSFSVHLHHYMINVILKYLDPNAKTKILLRKWCFFSSKTLIYGLALLLKSTDYELAFGSYLPDLLWKTVFLMQSFILILIRTRFICFESIIFKISLTTYYQFRIKSPVTELRQDRMDMPSYLLSL